MRSSDALYNEPLAQRLDTEISYYEAFLDLLEEERELLRTPSYPALCDLNDRKSECLARIRDLAQRRPAGVATRTGYSESPPPEARSRHDRLNELVSRIREAMTFNHRAIERSLGRVEALLSLWSHAVTDNATYRSTGNHESRGGHGQFVSARG